MVPGEGIPPARAPRGARRAGAKRGFIVRSTDSTKLNYLKHIDISTGTAGLPAAGELSAATHLTAIAGEWAFCVRELQFVAKVRAVLSPTSHER